MLPLWWIPVQAQLYRWEHQWTVHFSFSFSLFNQCAIYLWWTLNSTKSLKKKTLRRHGPLHFELVFVVVVIVCQNKPYPQQKTYIVKSLICALQQINGNSNATTNRQLTVRCYVWKLFSCAANTFYSSQVVYANK